MFVPSVYLAIFLVSTCGLSYQLVLAATASYLTGQGVSIYAFVIGAYLSALGLGAAASRRITDAPAQILVSSCFATATIGGPSAQLVYLAHARSGFLLPVLTGVLLATGLLVGIQLPLLLRVLRRHVSLRALAARALAADYAGGVTGSLLVALWVVPRLGHVRTGLAFGILHALSGILVMRVLGPAAGPHAPHTRTAATTLAGLAVLFVLSERTTAFGEDAMFTDPIVHAERSAYQRIVVTAGRSGWQLFLDGNLQFASADEYRYHEALVHPAMSAAARPPERVLVLGGGDGLAVREILRHPSVRSVTLVDIDPAITGMARAYAPLRRLNAGSLADPRVTVVNDDALVWLAAHPDPFDVAIVDFPDPNNYTLGKLYTRRFYALLRERIVEGGAAVVQSTSPLAARRSFWCIVRTLEAAGWNARPYHAFVPSFGEWGYVLVTHAPTPPPAFRPVAGLRWLDAALLPTLFHLPADLGPLPADVNRLSNQVLVQYYEQEWSHTP